ncbi:MAG: acyltransferase family protein [Bacteroidales bacterium]|nr:acyltransferase family protein [Bacteroidales bacterium]
MPTKPRIAYLDLAKGLCISLVVLFHATTYFPIEMPADHALKSMRLPLYFFLSGCFFKPYSGFIDFLKHKTNKLLIPLFFGLLSPVSFSYMLIASLTFTSSTNNP